MQTGLIAYNKKAYADAKRHFQKVIELQPTNAEAHSNLGAVYAKFNEQAKALSYYKKSISLKPEYAGAYSNMGNLLSKMGEYEQAVSLHLQALEREPKNATFLSNLGSAYKHLGRFDRAESLYKKSLSINAKNPDVHFDLATVLLQTGQNEEGLKEYEWRFKKEEMQGHLKRHKAIYEQNRWRGEKLEGKKILIHSEQGYGDTLMMARYLYTLKERGAYVILYIKEELKTLLQSLPCVDEVQVYGELPKPFNFHLPLMSLALECDKELKELTKHYPYLFAPKQKTPLPATDKKLKIGLVWGASNTGDSYAKKVLRLEGFKKLLEEEQIEVYSLQLGSDASQIKELRLEEKIIDLSEALKDFSHTASIISQLALVISSDTSVCHLSGAMGKETWVLLQKVPDWRWGVDGEHSIWYPSTRLFRQYSLGNWDEVYERVYQAVLQRVKDV